MSEGGAGLLEQLDGAALRRWCSAGLAALTAARDEIDDLNVYPVPDGDTGTNLQLTLAAVVEAVTAAPADLPATVAAIITGSLMGARGNSGVILSQLLRGMGEVWAPLDAIGPDALRQSLVRGASSAYAAVAAPVEGTVLTVARAAAEAASGGTLVAVVTSARHAAEEALVRTTEQLPALEAAGVVDAGGRGWCVLLEALEQVVTGVVPVAAPAMLVPRDRSGLAAAREAGSAEFAYEVQFLLRDSDDGRVAQLKARLRGLGDSLVVVGGGDLSEGLYNVHVHVNDVGAAVEVGVDAGRPFRIHVTRFQDQMAQLAAPAQARAVVAVAPGEGLRRLFRDAGAYVVPGGPTSNPSTTDLLSAMRLTGAQEVVLLPNDRNVLPVAEAAASAAREEGRDVVVIPTRSVLQGLSAVSIADRATLLDVDASAMTAAALATRCGAVTRAVRAAETAVGRCLQGDVLGLVEGAVVVIERAVGPAAQRVLTHLLAGGGEQVTVLLGADADTALGVHLADHLRVTHPGVDVLVLDGGQSHYDVLLGVE
jgi:DAK2 domain fusion protein YloV